MLFKGFHGPSVAEVGDTLADEFLSASGAETGRWPLQHSKGIRKFLSRVDAEARPLQLGIFRKARLANSFKWRLLENGLPPPAAEELTQMLLLRLSVSPSAATPEPARLPPTTVRARVQALLAQAHAAATRGVHAEATTFYRQALEIKPRDVVARTNLGVALYKQGQYAEAEDQFREAIAINPRHLDGQLYLGAILRDRGRIVESELPLQQAVKLSPRNLDARVSLGQTFLLLGRLRHAVECFEKAHRLSPRNAAACLGLGRVASLEGRFEEAQTWFGRALEVEDMNPGAWAGLAGLRKMTTADADWLRRVQKIASSELPPLERADLCFAIGKYWDDLGEYNKAFDSYRQANELQKSAVVPYARAERARFVDDTIRVYSRSALAAPCGGRSDSARPVFVIGMMRSGTSLVEQILASHPGVHGCGELQFWNDAARKHEPVLQGQLPHEALCRRLAADYLQTLASYSVDALRVVDKSTFNSDHLGLIHAVFPNARIIYLRRDPVDTCLSCYFQQFSAAHNFTMDLADLVHYYRQHQRLIAHWRAVLPVETLLEVPYAELVASQETWTRRILAFLDLEWDERCLEFHLTQRPVVTASFWQVRQKLYGTAVGRWRNYRKFIGPLRELREMET